MNDAEFKREKELREFKAKLAKEEYEDWKFQTDIIYGSQPTVPQPFTSKVSENSPIKKKGTKKKYKVYIGVPIAVIKEVEADSKEQAEEIAMRSSFSVNDLLSKGNRRRKNISFEELQEDCYDDIFIDETIEI